MNDHADESQLEVYMFHAHLVFLCFHTAATSTGVLEAVPGKKNYFFRKAHLEFKSSYVKFESTLKL